MGELPLLDVWVDPDAVSDGYPFDVPALRSLPLLRFDTAVTLFVGENGTGKSTLLEAIALREAESAGAQVLMTTHASILVAYPGATILSFDGGSVARAGFDDLEHVRLTRAVLADPAAFTHHL